MFTLIAQNQISILAISVVKFGCNSKISVKFVSKVKRYGSFN